jgi:hypothetical protein
VLRSAAEKYPSNREQQFGRSQQSARAGRQSYRARDVRHDRFGARWCTNEPHAKTCARQIDGAPLLRDLRNWFETARLPGRDNNVAAPAASKPRGVDTQSSAPANCHTPQAQGRTPGTRSQAERVRHRRALFPEHRDPGGRQANQRRHRSGRRSRADVRVGLSPWQKPLSRVGLAGGGLGDGHGSESASCYGTRRPLLRTRLGLTPTNP